MTEQTLPAVAKSIHTFCKKCDAERYHTVLAHSSATSAKVQCEICKAKKTFKVASEKAAPKVTKSGKAAKPRSTSPRSAAGRLAAHENEYQSMLSSNGEVAPYNMKMKFNTNQKIQHPKFGVGIVKVTHQDKVEVVFSDEVRNLVHNRV